MPLVCLVLLLAVVAAQAHQSCGSAAPRRLGPAQPHVALDGNAQLQAHMPAARRLAQDSSPLSDGVTPPRRGAPAAEGLDEAAPWQKCLDLNNALGYACSVGIDRVAGLAFPRGSTSLPTEAQMQQALAALRQGGLPGRG